MPTPSQPPPLAGNGQRDRDREQLRLLVIFHYLLAVFAVFGIVFLIFHYAVMSTVFMNEKMWEEAEGGPPPVEFFMIFRWFYLFMGAFFVGDIVVNVLSAVFIQRRRHRMFSMVVGGINCIQFPVGTALGVFTLMILGRPSVREVYEEAASVRE